MRWLLALLCCCGLAAAAPSLSVAGFDVPGLTLELVDGTSYAPAAPFAEALGATLLVDHGAGVATLEAGGRLAVLRTFATPDEAAGATGALTVNGRPVPGPGGVFSEGQLYLPVAAVAQAFGGYTSYLEAQERVLVILPRARVRGLEARREGQGDRIVLSLDGNVPFSAYLNRPLNRLELRLQRTDAARVAPLEDGRRFSQASVLQEAGAAELRIDLQEGTGYEIYTVPQDRGYQLVVDLFEDGLAGSPPPPLRIVIDPGHGGEDAGVPGLGGSESEATLELALQLAQELRQRGYMVQLTRSHDADVPLPWRSGLGVGADLFLSLHLHERAGGDLGVYYLDEAADSAILDLAIRENAEAELAATTDALRRRLLLNLVPDLEVGRRYAQAMQGLLFTAAGYRTAEPQGAPLAVLAGAAGRGLLLELPASAAADEALPRALADAMTEMLEGADRTR